MQPNFDAFRAAPLNAEPFPHCVVTNFFDEASVNALIKDYPKLDMAGLFLPEETSYGPEFNKLLDMADGPELRQIVGEKLGVDLTSLKTMITVRANCQGKDGRIHADAKFKVATVLLYLNEPWQDGGGRLRVLRSGSDIEDYAGEVPPNGGTLFCFKVQSNSWHGHKPFVGVRRYLMINYCTSEELRNKEWSRHLWSGRWKKVLRLFGVGKIAA